MTRNAFIKFAKRYAKVIIVLCTVLALSGYLVFQLFILKPVYITVRIKGSPGNWWWVTPRPPDWLVNAIKVGDKEYAAMNKPIAEIVAVDTYDAGGPTKDIYVTARIEVRHNKQTNKYSYKGEPVEIGGPISMNLNRAFFPGMVVDIYGKDAPQKQYIEKTLVVRHNARWPYEFEAFNQGDKITDGTGNVIAEIIDKKRFPAEKEAVTITGQIVKSYSPVYDDFFITVKLKVININNELIYREEQYLKVGSKVWLMFPNYNISEGEIVSIQ